MNIEFRRGSFIEKLSVTEGSTIAAVAKLKKMNRETFIAKLNGKVAHENEALKEGDRLEIVNVIFGG